MDQDWESNTNLVGILLLLLAICRLGRTVFVGLFLCNYRLSGGYDGVRPMQPGWEGV